MKTEIYYFTGTGNGLHIAKSIKEKLIEEVVLIPINTLNLTSRIKSDAESVAIIFPTYAMTAPDIVKRFATQLRTKTDAYVYLYGHSGGGGAKGAISAIQKILYSNDISISNTFETTLPSNSAMMKLTEDKIKNVISKSEISIKENAEKIANKERERIKKPNVVNEFQIIIGSKLAGAFENFVQFKVISHDDSCIGCSTCQKVCPIGNIEMVKGKPQFSDTCEMCMGCVNQCPKQSLAFGKMKKKNLKSYRHPNVTLKELMYR